MRIGQFVGSLSKAALLCACVYGVVKWQGFASHESDAEAFAKRACVDEVGAGYQASNARLYDIRESRNGYVVRVSATLPRGAAAKFICLTNANGGVTDITIDER